jgi:hypothetical protein
MAAAPAGKTAIEKETKRRKKQGRAMDGEKVDS